MDAPKEEKLRGGTLARRPHDVGPKVNGSSLHFSPPTGVTAIDAKVGAGRVARKGNRCSMKYVGM